jgi:O-antigen/teichoic acid export membrane protein
VLSYPVLVYTIFDARSLEASLKYLSEFNARGERDRELAMCKLGYAVDCTIVSIAFLVVLVTAPWAAESVVHRSQVAGLIILYAAALLPGALVPTSYAVLATFGQFYTIALIDIITALVRVVLVLSLVFSGWQLAGVVWGNAVATILSGLLYGASACILTLKRWKASWLQGRWQALGGRRREIVGFLVYNDLNSLLGIIPKQLDVTLLGYLRGPAEVGFYKLAKSLAGIAGYLVGPLQWVSFPELARVWGGDENAFREKVRAMGIKMGLPSGLCCLAGTMLIPFVLPQLVGQAYDPAVIAVELLLVGSATWLTFFWLRPTYSVTGRIKQWSIGIAVYAVSFSVLSIPFTFWLGFLGMSIVSSAVTIIFHTVMASRLVLKELKK